MELDDDIYSDLYIKVVYRAEYNTVNILANESGLKYLQAMLQTLIDSDVPRKHFHFATYSGLEGNVNELTVMKGEKGDEPH